MVFESAAATVDQRLVEIVLAPLNNPGIIPSLLPLALGAVVLELYFGKYEHESLGWNTSVGNAVIWVTTGINLILTNSLTGTERLAAYGLIVVGALIGYMNFFHKWGQNIAFRASSSGIIYTVGYITVIVAGTDIPVNEVTFKAGGVFMAGVLVAFHFLQGFETSADDDIQLSYN